MSWHHLALVVTPDPTGDGLAVEVDERRRVRVPGWLRQRGREVLVGLDPTGPVLLVTPVEVLDGLGDVLAGLGPVTATGLRARVLLAEARELGLDLADLIAAADSHPAVPTVAEHLRVIEATFTAATAATYRPCWRLAVELHGPRRLGELTIVDLQAAVEAAAERARRNRPGSTGRSSQEACVAALRALYRRALDAGLVTANPTAALTKPRRARPRRRALDDTELTDLTDAVRATSPDPALDLLLVRFHLETGARRSGALAMRTVDLDARRGTIWLDEKGGSREQPIRERERGLLGGSNNDRAEAAEEARSLA